MQIAKFVVAKSDKKIMEEKAKFEYDKRMIYMLSNTVNQFIGVTLSRVYNKNSSAKVPSYDDIFPSEEKINGVEFDDKGVVVKKSSAFDFLIQKSNYMEEQKKGEK